METLAGGSGRVAQRILPSSEQKGILGILGTDEKFPVLGSATELPGIAADGPGVLNVNYKQRGQAPPRSRWTE